MQEHCNQAGSSARQRTAGGHVARAKWPTALATAVLALMTVSEAQAGPDWQLIEHARRAKQQQAGADKALVTVACANKPAALPLDHGPRAQTTPAANELLKQRLQDQQRSGVQPAC